MDELLPNPESVLPAPARVKAPTRRHLPTLPKLRWTARPLPNFMERRSKLDPIVFLTVALSLTSAGVLGHLYGPGYEMTLDGQSVGMVESRQMVASAVDRVEARASRILGYDYSLTHTLDYTYHLTLREDLMPVTQVETYLFDQIGEVMKVPVLTVNGQVIGAAEDETALNTLLESIKAPYVNDNTVEAHFLQPINVSREYTATASLLELDDIYATLTANSVEQVDYTVQSGDTFSAIANSRGMTVRELQTLNPDTNIDRLWVGQTLVVSQAVPFLSVQTLDNVTYDGPVDFEVQEVPDDSMYQGNSKILTPGVEGLATYNADVTYVNGVEQTRIINTTNVITQPTTQVVAVGTKPRPKTMATGSFIWPIYGRVNSGYGSRYIFGSYSFHSGLDIAGSYGAGIKAADGGRVTFAGTGTGSYWSYGKYVVIDHENGLQTIYAHCSSLDVKAGDRVYQGQIIARVGSTGRSTGNHCHFQVKANGTTVNPWNYLP